MFKVATRKWCYDNFGKFNSTNKCVKETEAALEKLYFKTPITNKLITENRINSSFSPCNISISATLPYAESTVARKNLIITATIDNNVSSSDPIMISGTYYYSEPLTGGASGTYNFTVIIPANSQSGTTTLSVDGSIGGLVPESGMIPILWTQKFTSLTTNTKIFTYNEINYKVKLIDGGITMYSSGSGIETPVDFNYSINNLRLTNSTGFVPGSQNTIKFELTVNDKTPASGIVYALNGIGDSNLTYSLTSSAPAVKTYSCTFIIPVIEDANGTISYSGQFIIKGTCTGYLQKSKTVYITPPIEI